MYQQSSTKEIEFADINDIYEIVKEVYDEAN